MPLYEYELVDTSTGALLGQVNLARAVAERDGVTVRRRTVPRQVGIAGAAGDPGEGGRQVLETYRRLEQRMGNTTEFARKIGHSAEAVKRAWQ